MTTIGGAVAVELACVLVVACQGTAERRSSTPASATRTAVESRTAAATGPTTCPAAEPGLVDPASVLVPGPGPGMPSSTARGVGLVIVGVVLDAECRPAAGASIDVWHTDARGSYGPAEDQCCYYQGAVRTDSSGRFRLETIRPGRYDETTAPPAHIHTEIRYRSVPQMAEIVFSGDTGVPRRRWVTPSRLPCARWATAGPGTATRRSFCGHSGLWVRDCVPRGPAGPHRGHGVIPMTLSATHGLIAVIRQRRA